MHVQLQIRPLDGDGNIQGYELDFCSLLRKTNYSDLLNLNRIHFICGLRKKTGFIEHTIYFWIHKSRHELPSVCDYYNYTTVALIRVQ